MTVRTKDGQRLDVMAYVMTGLCREPSVPSGYYYTGILDGYRQNGLPAAALERAWAHAVREVYTMTEQANRLSSQRTKPAKRKDSHER